MKKVLVFFALFLAACAPSVTLETVGPQASPRPSALAQEVNNAVPSATATLTPAPSATPDIYADLHPRQTELALDEQELAIEERQLRIQLTSDAATSTATYALGMVLANQANNTAIAKTRIAGTATQSAKDDVQSTQTQAAITDQENTDKAVRIGWNIFFSLVALVTLVLAATYLWKRIHADIFQRTQIKPDEKGRLPSVPEDTIPGKSKRIMNPNLAHRAVLDPKQDDLSAEQALKNAQDARRLEAVRAVADSPFVRRLAQNVLKTGEEPAGAGNGSGVNVGPVPMQADRLLPLQLPDWRLLNKWDGHLLPYGADGNQKLLTVDPAKRPHLMVTGTTGTGKTRYEIRTIVAGALTSGWQVIVIGKQADYLPFEEHPNVTLIPANAVKEPSKYIQILKAASEQMFARDEFLVSKKLSTWERYGGPQTLIVVDDYSAAMMMMPSVSAKEVLRWALAIAMDGRKYGLNLLLGLQRATWTCISTDLRSQMGRIALRVESARDSRVVLDEEGAESLPERHFLARLEDGQQLIRGAAFAMSDAETFAFLSSRSTQPVEKPAWIEGVIHESSQAVSTGQTQQASSQGTEEDTKRKIIDLYLEYVDRQDVPNYTAIQRSVWGTDDKPGGAHFNQVKQVIADFEGITVEELAALNTKRVTTTGKMPDSGPIAA